MPFSKVVDLYRLSGRPKSKSASSFRGHIDFELRVQEIIQELKLSQTGEFRSLTIDGDDFCDIQTLPLSGKSIDYDFSVATGGGTGQFYATLDEFIQKGSLFHGNLPDQFYIVDQDFYNKEDQSLLEINVLTSVCSLVKELSKVADYHDEKRRSRSKTLVFLPFNNDGSSEPAIVKTTFQRSDLPKAPLELSILTELNSEAAHTAVHYQEKLKIFKSSLAEFLNTKGQLSSSFKELIQSWDQFLKLYQNNLGIYLSGFSFQKLKQEIADNQLKIAAELSKVLNEITGRLLAIPIAFGVSLTVSKLNHSYEAGAVLLALFVATVIIVYSIGNQKRQLKRVECAKVFLIDTHENNYELLPDELKCTFDLSQKEISSDFKALRIKLRIFYILAWVPLITGLVVFACKDF